jgi:D-lactate dehydrogenase
MQNADVSTQSSERGHRRTEPYLTTLPKPNMLSRLHRLARGQNLRPITLQRTLTTLKGKSRRLNSPVFLISISLATGFAIGRASSIHDNPPSQRALPSGLPRTCCDDDLTPEQLALPAKLARIVGKENILDGRQENTRTSPFLIGARLGGGGEALAIITPRSLREVVSCVRLIVDADCVILPQGANTGLTGGSVPRSQTGDKRPIVVLSMKHLDAFFPIDDGKRVVCMAGAGLATLSRKLPMWFPDRESHSILGSTFLNPTTAAGVALGSGGTQLRKGPSYTDRAMYIKVHRNKFGENVVEIVNNLGILGIEDENFQEGKGGAVDQLDAYQLDVKEGFTRAMARSSDSKNGSACAHDASYAHQICVQDHNVSRYNANCSGSECNRSEGKVLILATVHDTFPRPIASRTFWISFDDLQTALQFRREVCLTNPDDLPVSMEYMNRDAFDVVDQSGRVMASVIKVIGLSGAMLRHLWNAKLWVDSLPYAGAGLWCDKIMYRLNPLFPATLPARIMDAGKTMDHHVAMTVGEFGNGNMEKLLDRLQSFASKHGKNKIVIHECQSASEVLSLTAFRFVAAPAFRTWCVGAGVQGISVDYALPKNGGQIPKLSTLPLKRMRYSHFGCNVVHEDLALPHDVDALATKLELKAVVEHDSGGKLPAEHGHGTEYRAPSEAQERWKKMDPLNVFNPGVGGLSYKARYQE